MLMWWTRVREFEKTSPLSQIDKSRVISVILGTSFDTFRAIWANTEPAYSMYTSIRRFGFYKKNKVDARWCCFTWPVSSRGFWYSMWEPCASPCSHCNWDDSKIWNRRVLGHRPEPKCFKNPSVQWLQIMGWVCCKLANLFLWWPCLGRIFFQGLKDPWKTYLTGIAFGHSCKRDTSAVLENLSNNIWLPQNGVSYLQAQDKCMSAKSWEDVPQVEKCGRAHTCVPPGPVHDGLEGQSCKESEGTTVPWNKFSKILLSITFTYTHTTEFDPSHTSKGAPKSQSHICPANLRSEVIHRELIYPIRK